MKKVKAKKVSELGRDKRARRMFEAYARSNNEDVDMEAGKKKIDTACSVEQRVRAKESDEKGSKKLRQQKGRLETSRRGQIIRKESSVGSGSCRRQKRGMSHTAPRRCSIECKE